MARLFARNERQAGPRAGSAKRRHPLGRWGTLVVILLVIGVAGLVAETVTSAPAVCTACHEMSVRSVSWRASAHAGVKCVSCHQPPREWYAWPLTLVDRSGLIARDVVAHFANDYESPIDTRSASTGPMPDSVCLQCHDVNRKATSGFRIRIDHPEHAKRNGSCVSCHVRTAHPLPDRGGPLTLMAQCYTCHGTTSVPEAGTACTLCHPSGFELEPASHKPRAWQRGHGKTSLSDPKQCGMCHKTTFCRECHGLEMPHPQNWAKIGEPGHADYAEGNRAVCTRCHEEKPDLCSMCHHKAWNPTRGTWVQQHFIEVGEQGANYCMKCHVPVFCVRCHVSFATQN